MERLKRGDIVARKSYGKDILFRVEKIITIDKIPNAVLKGLIERIEADSPVEDLEIIEKSIVNKNIKNFEDMLETRIKRCIQSRFKRKVYTGKILHLDGDKRYSQKSVEYYKKVGLDATVKNITERNQPLYIKALLKKYKPDVLVITGHDGMIKKETGYNDISNYRNSKYFIDSVKQARSYSDYGKDLAIFAGACQSYYEAIISAGANFASSPARILIDFIDPLIVAEKIAITEDNRYVTIEDIKNELRDGEKGIGGIGVKGKKVSKDKTL